LGLKDFVSSGCFGFLKENFLSDVNSLKTRPKVNLVSCLHAILVPRLSVSSTRNMVALGAREFSAKSASTIKFQSRLKVLRR
jgi:hypothetical protein